MGTIIFKCKWCSSSISVSKDKMGHIVICNECRKRNTVPKCSLIFDCPHCNKHLIVSKKYLGGGLACPSCNNPIDIQESEDNGDLGKQEKEEVAAVDDATNWHGDILVLCNGCNSCLVVDSDGINKEFACPNCQTNVSITEPTIFLQCPSCTWDLASYEYCVGEVFSCPNCQSDILLENNQSDLIGSEALQTEPNAEEASEALQTEPNVEEASEAANIGDTNNVQDNEADWSVPLNDPEIIASCPKCGRDDVPFICSNCERINGGMTITDDGSVECYCGINADQMTCPDCGATILKKWFRKATPSTAISTDTIGANNIGRARRQNQFNVADDSNLIKPSKPTYSIEELTFMLLLPPLGLISLPLGFERQVRNGNPWKYEALKVLEIVSSISSIWVIVIGTLNPLWFLLCLILIPIGIIAHVYKKRLFASECISEKQFIADEKVQKKIKQQQINTARQNAMLLQATPQMQIRGTKNRSAAILLAILFGGFGFHEFYLNKPIAGVISLLFCWTGIPWLFAIFEAVCWLFTSDERFRQQYG